MIRGSGIDIRKIILGIVLLTGVNFSLYSQGAHIGGVINVYRHVVSVGGIDNINVSDGSVFEVGDTVLLIQMKGAIVNVPEDGYYGTYQFSVGSPGSYEFLIIESKNINNIVFTREILNSYDVAGMMQLIKVPSFNSASVDSRLTCEPWDSTTKTGGVVTFIVGGNLSLNADIDVTGKGFIGGTPYVGNGICTSVDPALYDKFSYPVTDLYAGFKGEGVAIREVGGTSLFPDYAKGKGNNYTSGGGGTGRFSGGGGGAGKGTGGNGGRELNTCTLVGGGGVGGKTDSYNELDTKILMGSGGGSSIYEAGATPTSGGRGGGIIIILSDTIKGNGNNVMADGQTPAISTSGNAGAGGGGGGGSVALYQQSFSSQSATSALNISVIGGKGGNALNSFFGEGGGGGGGLILTNNLTFPPNVDTLCTGGLVGTRRGASTGTNGKNGKSHTSFIPLLNGFLFNTIRSSVSYNHVDSVCSNLRPPKIIGTKPVGGTGPYTYIWEKSYVSTFATSSVLTNDTDPTNYTPSASDAITPTDTVWFRRTVIDAGFPQITDISKAVKIIVHPEINNNNIGLPDTFCQSGNPDTIRQILPDLIIPTNKYLLYTWQDSINSSTQWNNITGFVNTPDSVFEPPFLTTTTSYRRIVISGSCIDTSISVKMTILPNITGNSIKSREPAEDSVCFGMQFQELISAKTLGGGDNSYKYKWESSINYSPWLTASGISDRDSLDPVELAAERIPENYYRFRRIVYSGPDSICMDISDTVHLRDFPLITNFNLLVGASPPICSGSAPARIIGNTPNNGNGLFTWQDSTNSSSQWNDIAGFVNKPNPDYQPPILTLTTKYRRITHSYGCSATSDPIEITVLPPIINNNISLSSLTPDTIICSGRTPNRFIGTPAAGGDGTYGYQWKYGVNDAGPFSDVTGATQIDYPNPPSLNVTTFYKRQVTSDACISVSSTTITINVLPPIFNNIVTSYQPAVCENSMPGPVTGSSVAGGSGTYLYLWEQSSDDGASWIAADGTNTLPDYQPPALASAIMYRRNVSSADCFPNTSPTVDISINPKPQGPVYAGADETIYSLDRDYYMNADPPVVSGETGLWTVLEPGTGMIENVSESKSEVRNLSAGNNLFVWSITNGLCNIDDSVNIELLPDLIPQGFSPNGDAWNNRFIIEGLNLSDQQIADLTILNGAGTVVFTATNRNGNEWVDWDGRNNKGNELPEGTYYYLLNVTTNEKLVIRKSGFIELKR